MNPPPSKRMIIIVVSAVEVVIFAAILLILFGFSPMDISGLDITPDTVAIVADLWYLSSLGILIVNLEGMSAQ